MSEMNVIFVYTRLHSVVSHLWQPKWEKAKSPVVTHGWFTRGHLARKALVQFIPPEVTNTVVTH